MMLMKQCMASPLYKAGDKVRVKTSQKTGVIQKVYDAEYWNLYTMDGGDHEYGIQFDDGTTSNIVERVLEASEKVSCTCGAHATSFPNIHSSWCDFVPPRFEGDNGNGD